MEIWKEVPGTYGKIMVSNEGRVKSLLRDGRILRPSKDGKGYLRLHITINQQRMGFKVHRLVAQAFIPNPNNLPQVNHIDGNKENNDVSNLEWISNRDNANHAIKNGLWDSVIDGARKENKLRKKAVIAYRNNEFIEFESISDAEKYFGSRHIVDVLKGRRQHVKGWSFSYAEGGDDNVNPSTW